MKLSVGIAFFLFAASALAGCGQHTGDYGAYGSAHQTASDARPVYRAPDPLYRGDCQKDYRGVACGGN